MSMSTQHSWGRIPMTKSNRTRCALTTKLLTYLYENRDQSAIVGPYSNERRITTAVAAFNRSYRPYIVTISQRKVLVVNPVTGTTDMMWEVRVTGAKKKKKEAPRK